LPDDLQRRVLAAVRRHAAEGLLPRAAATVALPADEFESLCRAVDFTPAPAGPLPASDALPSEHLHDLVALLWAHRADAQPWTRLMAGTLASACFGARHLWQDLGAAGRPEVSALLAQHFPAIAARNVRDLKWKNHLFRCLGEELGIAGLRPPRCTGCDEYSLCFPDAASTIAPQIRSMHAVSAPEEQPARTEGRGVDHRRR